MPVYSDTTADPGPSAGVRLQRASIPMRDGVRLNANVYTPRQGSRVPAVMEITPYNLDHTQKDGLEFVAGGLAYVVIDVRGRGDSEGTFGSVAQDAFDGYDAIEWISQQPWCDGQVALYGGSYTGQNQWLMLGQRPPALKAASPAAAYAAAIDIPRGGVPNLYNYKWEAGVWGRAIYFQSASFSGFWHPEILERLNAGEPAWKAAEAFGIDMNDDRLRFLDQPAYGPVWADSYSTDEQVAAIDVPVLTVSGTHDDCLSGTLFHWDRFERLASNEVRALSHLVIGPWDHAGTDSGDNRVGDLQFGPAAQVNLKSMRIAWFRHIMLGEAKPDLLADRFTYYVAGVEQWRSEATLEAATTGTVACYLGSTEGPNDVFHSGWLTTEPAEGPDYTITIDPADRRTIELELLPRPGMAPDHALFAPSYNSVLMLQGGNDPTNAVFTVSLDGEGLVYHSPPVKEALTIVGSPSLSLRIIPDSDDADLSLQLHEVRPSGDAIFMSSDLIRLSHRVLGSEPQLLVPGEEQTVTITEFRWCARQLGVGSRLRLTVRSVNSALMPADPHATGEKGVTTIRVLHRASDPSVLTIPLGESSLNP